MARHRGAFDFLGTLGVGSTGKGGRVTRKRRHSLATGDVRYLPDFLVGKLSPRGRGRRRKGRR